MNNELVMSFDTNDPDACRYPHDMRSLMASVKRHMKTEIKCVLCDAEAVTTAARIPVCEKHWHEYEMEYVLSGGRRLEHVLACGLTPEIPVADRFLTERPVWEKLLAEVVKEG